VNGAARRASFPHEFRAKQAVQADTACMSVFGSTPIPPTSCVGVAAPGVVQASFIAQHASGARAREKAKPKDADPPRRAVHDAVEIRDPLQAEAIDPKPDAAEEWKYRRNRGGPHDRDTRTEVRKTSDAATDGVPHIDVKA